MRGNRNDSRPSDRQDNGDAKQVSGTAARRKDRVPLGVARQKLAVPERPGYKRRWINDDGSRLQQALAADYRYVEDPSIKVGDDNGNSSTDSRISRVVGKKKNGQEMRAYLMEISADLYREDQKAKQAEIDEVDRAIRKGGIRNDRGDMGYVPDGGIKIERERPVRRARQQEQEEPVED